MTSHANKELYVCLRMVSFKVKVWVTNIVFLSNGIFRKDTLLCCAYDSETDFKKTEPTCRSYFTDAIVHVKVYINVYVNIPVLVLNILLIFTENITLTYLVVFC